ncbi:mannose-1-phosphate guanylyltransferase [Halobellus sp. Atlit-38R]|uniref:mannose-1-phosphate guanylyltransferase n=1 Tax=Halobellus sp. Atlit-38R TaxID=2282131 RepID=UPI000EF287C3|nr:sugar phosphate nucleotidyltransferase [Halobellus sp. Atlit-38R]RLM90688.1 mannose-1-phosphate guanylyltransferase [Halobellus sp. Atlit-38R]
MTDNVSATEKTEASIPVVAVVLAGGTGSRLYPASRSDRPKQFLPLVGEESLLEGTVSRARDVADEVVVVTREEYTAGVRDRAPDADVLVEPAGRDTGPALLYATHDAAERYGDCVVLALPSDHLVGEGFAPAVRRGVAVAATEDRLVTFGVEPTRPETGYGYIEPAAPTTAEGAEPTTGSDPAWKPVRSFHEKPDAETAESYLAAGHYWNAGLFAWRPAVFLDAAATSPLADLLDALRSAGDLSGDHSDVISGDHSDVESEDHSDVITGDHPDVTAAFEATESVSVDHAIFEGADDVAVVPVAFPWDDVGSWDALERVLGADGTGNVAGEDVTLRTLDAADNVVAADGAHVSLVGVSDLAVVAWDDRVLVVPKERAQDVKRLVRSLEERGEF